MLNVAKKFIIRNQVKVLKADRKSRLRKDYLKNIKLLQDHLKKIPDLGIERALKQAPQRLLNA